MSAIHAKKSLQETDSVSRTFSGAPVFWRFCNTRSAPLRPVGPRRAELAHYVYAPRYGTHRFVNGALQHSPATRLVTAGGHASIVGCLCSAAPKADLPLPLSMPPLHPDAMLHPLRPGPIHRKGDANTMHPGATRAVAFDRFLVQAGPPGVHHKCMKSTNTLQRLDEKIRRRTRVVHISPNAERWLLSERCFPGRRHRREPARMSALPARNGRLRCRHWEGSRSGQTDCLAHDNVCALFDGYHPASPQR